MAVISTQDTGPNLTFTQAGANTSRKIPFIHGHLLSGTTGKEGLYLVLSVLGIWALP